MGTFRCRIEIAATPDGPFEALDALVDTGATYTVVPRPVLARLGIEAVDRQPFVLADGRRIERDVGEAVLRVDRRTRTNLVVFGDEGTEVLLGAFTLESFLLAADPVNRRLVPVSGYLVGIRWEASDDS